MTKRLRVAAAVAVGALAVGGCSRSESSDDRDTVPSSPKTTVPATNVPATGGPGTSGPPTSAPVATTTAAATTAATTTAEPSPSTTDPAAEQMLIGAAFFTFFGGTASDVDDASANEQFQAMSIDIRSIRLLDADACAAMGEVSPCAVVTHDLFVGAAPALVGQDSTAVRIGGEWKVAASAWCRVVAIGGEQCP
jgi:hypothetical protein